MKTRRHPLVPACLTLALALGGAALSTLRTRPAEAQVPPPASASASASAPLPTMAPPPVAHVWPKEPSPEPKEEEWSGATKLGEVPLKGDDWTYRGMMLCTKSALRDWVRVSCVPPMTAESGPYFGVIWAMAGDASTVKSSFLLNSELPTFAAAPKDIIEDLTRKMAAHADVTFQVKPGSALVLDIDRIGWAWGYDGSSVDTSPGVELDVSWALGEDEPSFVIR